MVLFISRQFALVRLSQRDRAETPPFQVQTETQNKTYLKTMMGKPRQAHSAQQKHSWASQNSLTSKKLVY